MNWRKKYLTVPTRCDRFKSLGHILGDFPNVEFIGNNDIHIGTHQDMGEVHIDYFMNTIEEFLLQKT